MNSLVRLILSRHSIRDYTGGAVLTAVYPEEDRMRIVRDACGIPANIIPLNVILIGVPAKKDSKPVDKFKIENIHRDIW